MKTKAAEICGLCYFRATKNFVVYKSSAGSGKTFTLVREFLRLSLHDEKKLQYNFRRILAITFTNKAAAEMKNRVVGALSKLAEGEQDTLSAQLRDALSVSQQELERRAGVVLRAILHNYSDLSIGTIDSFTHKIVRTFAHDLDLPVNFNIELDTQAFYEKVVAELFSTIGEDEYVSKLLKDYALTKATDNASWDPEGHIREFARLLQRENSGEYIEKLKNFDTAELESFRQQFLDFIRHYRHTIREGGDKALQLIRSKGLSDDDFNYKASGPQNFFRKCFETRVQLQDTEGTRIQDAIQKNKWAGKTSAAAEQAINTIAPQLKDLAEELIRFIRDNHTYYSLCELLSKQMYPLMLLRKIEEISQARKQEERLVFISEFNQKIFDIINTEPTPFIYERLGERYQHYLLDEFQDTSSMQWQNLLPLVDNSLGNGWFNLVVGDGKQSIYRWRNANVNQFAGLPDIENPGGSVVVRERADTLSRNYQEAPLNQNFRSSRKVIEFNNRFFSEETELSTHPQHLSIYKNHGQKAFHNHEGYVSIDAGRIPSEELTGQHLLKVREYISRALADNYSMRDICIICRKNEHGSIIASELMRQNIPVVSSESLLLSGNLEVNTLLCFLRHVMDPRDTISAATVLNYLFRQSRLTQHELHTGMRALSGGQLLPSLLAENNFALQTGFFTTANLYDSCVAINSLLELDKHAPQYIRFFLDEVLEFLSLHNSGLPEFFDWWENRQKKASLIIPESTDAVRIMTIHSSKGLEFPVVIIPFCNWTVFRPGDNWVQVRTERTSLPVSVVQLSKKAGESGFEEELEQETQAQKLDNINLLYVAFTRAAQRLHIVSTSSDNRKESVAAWIQKFIDSQKGEPGAAHWETGVMEKKTEGEKTKGLPSFRLQPLSFSGTGNQVRIKPAARMNHNDAADARREGILMHWLLGSIRTAEDIDAAVRRGVQSGEIAPDQSADFIRKLRDICNLAELARIFSSELRSEIERELITANGEILRPDRIVFDGEQVILLDYKTGQENNEVYARQLAGYAVALQDMGYLKIRKLLVYLDDPHVVELS